MRIPVDTPTGYMNVLCRLNLAGLPAVAYELTMKRHYKYVHVIMSVQRMLHRTHVQFKDVFKALLHI